MKIVFISDIYFPSIGGVEVETRRLAKKMAQKGHEVWIVAPSCKPFDYKKREGRINVFGIKSYPNPFYRSMPFVPFYSAKRKIFKILDEINPDIIHIQTSFLLAKAASLYSKKFAVASVATGHYAAGEFEHTFKILGISSLIGFVIKKFSKNVWKNVDLITFPSDFARKYFFGNEDNKGKIVILSNGIDINRFSNNLPKFGKNTILYVGRLEPHKNVECLIAAMPRILSKIDAKLILVGKGSQEQYLKKLVKKLGLKSKVVFFGLALEGKIKRIYKKANVFVTASLSENQPLSLLEAIASGLPIVATNVGGIPSLVKKGVNGFLFDPYDTKSLSEYVIKILSDKKLSTRMSKKSLEIAKEHDIEMVVDKLLSLYQKTISLKILRMQEIKTIPFYKNWLFKTAFAIAVFAILFRISLNFPSTTHAKGAILKNKIANSEIFRKINVFDQSLKTRFIKRAK